jgi:hypothetical protein
LGGFGLFGFVFAVVFALLDCENIAKARSVVSKAKMRYFKDEAVRGKLHPSNDRI